jgi:hypothetical protein
MQDDVAYRVFRGISDGSEGEPDLEAMNLGSLWTCRMLNMIDQRYFLLSGLKRKSKATHSSTKSKGSQHDSNSWKNTGFNR